MADALNFPVVDVQDPQDQSLDILQSAGPSRMAIPIHSTLLQPVQADWHTPASCTPTPNQYFFVPGKNRFLVLPSLTNSLVMQEETEYACQQLLKATPSDWATKKLDLLGRKVYTSAGLQVHIASYQAILAKYDFVSYSKLAEFHKSLLKE